MLMVTERALRPISTAFSAQDFAFIERRALEIAAQFDVERRERNAEVFPDVTPHWHVVTVLPGKERAAADDLSERCFGIYLPESEHTEIRRGRKIELKRLMIPGYVFVFVWDVDRHIDRIRACDGVRGLLFMDGRVVIVPDMLINRIRARENAERPLKGLTTSSEPAKKAKRCWRKTRKVDGKAEGNGDEVIGVHSYNPFLEELRKAASQSDEKLGAFHKALNAALHGSPESA
jgi:transcription antitermination factor NusG